MARPQPQYRKGDKIDGRFQVHDVKMGGMGEVYLCLDLEQMYPVALKTFQERFLTDIHLRKAFENEVSTWVALEVHPNIVHCSWMQSLDNRPFMCLEWVGSSQGYETDLRSRLSYRPLDLPTALLFTIDICRGLVHAQKKQPGLVHLDLKPENILVMQGMLVKITDFGLAQIVQQSELDVSTSLDKREGLIKRGNIVGTPPYMAPEQWEGGMFDPRTDIYAVGCILYEMLTGRRLFQAATLEDMRRQHQESAIPLLAEDNSLPVDTLNPIISHCLAKDREDRIADFEQLLNQLEALYHQEVGEPARSLSYPTGYEKFTATDYNNRGTTYGTLGQFEKAFADFDRAIAMETSREAISMAYANRGVTLNKVGKHEKALIDLNKAIELDSQNIVAYNSRASTLGDLGYYEKALADHNKCLELNPNDEATYVNRGITYKLMERYEESLADFASALKLNPNLIKAYTNRSNTYVSLGNYEAALLDLNQAIKLDPSSPLAYSSRGSLYDDLDNFEAALRDHNYAIYLDPRAADTYALRGITYHKLQDYASALADYDKAIELDPKNANTFYNRGNTYRTLRQFEQALEDYTRAIELNPKFSEAYDNRGITYAELGRHETALSDYSKAIEIDPENSNAYTNRGNSLSELLQFDAALADYNRAMELNSVSAKAYTNRGILSIKLRQFDAALADFSRAIELDPIYANAYFHRGTLYGEFARTKEALKDISRSIELEPSHAPAYHNRGHLYANLEQYNAALADYDRAIELNPTYALAYISRGTIFSQLERKQDALRDFNQAIRLNPLSSEGYMKRGTTYMLFRRYGEALIDFNKAIEVDPENADTYLIAGALLSQIGRVRQAFPYLEKAAERGHPIGKKLLIEGKAVLVGLEFKDSNTVQDFKERITKLPYKIDGGILLKFQQLLDRVRITIPDFGQEYLECLQQLAKDQEYLANPIVKPFKLVDQIGEQEVALPPDLDQPQQTSDPTQSTRDFVAQALYHLENRDYDKATEAFSAAMLFSPKDSTVYAGRASAYAEQGNYDKALKDYNQAIWLEPDEAYLYFSRGMVFIQQNRFNEAVDDFNQGVSIGPVEGNDCIKIAKALCDSDRREEAIPFLDKAVELGELEVAEIIRDLLSRLGMEAWLNTIDAEKMRAAVIRYPHIASAGYINMHEEKLLNNTTKYDRQFITSRLNLLRHAAQEQRNDFLFIGISLFKEFAQANSSEKLQTLVSDFPVLLQPGYVSFVIYPMLDKIPGEIKPELEERFIELQKIVNDKREQNR